MSADEHLNKDQFTDKHWDSVFQNSADELYPGKKSVSWEEDDHIQKHANAAIDGMWNTR
jgi:hypothetical protein